MTVAFHAVLGIPGLCPEAALGASGIPDGNGAVVFQDRPAEHFTELRVAGGTQNLHAGDLTQEAHIEHTMVGGTVLAHQSRPVHSQDHGEVQQGDVLHDLVVGPLEEGGVNGHHRLCALLGQAARHGDRVLLGDAHIEQTGGIGVPEAQQAGAAGHGGGDGADPGIFLCKLHHGLAEHIGIGDLFRAQALAAGGVKFAHAVVFAGLRLRRTVAPALLGDDVDENGLAHVPRGLEQADELLGVMSVHGSDVLEAHILEHALAQQVPLELLLGLVGEAVDRLTAGHLPGGLPEGLLEAEIALLGPEVAQMGGHTAHIGVDGHLIVVEDDHHGLPAGSSIVQGLVDHAAGGGTVTDEGDDLIVLARQLSCTGHAQGDGDGGAGVSGHEGVAVALVGLGEAGHSLEHTKPLKVRLAAGQQLMDVSLMTHVEHQAVLSGIKNGLNGDRQLHHAQIGRQMAAGLCHMGNNEIPDLGAQLCTLVGIQPLKIRVSPNGR